MSILVFTCFSAAAQGLLGSEERKQRQRMCSSARSVHSKRDAAGGRQPQ